MKRHVNYETAWSSDVLLSFPSSVTVKSVYPDFRHDRFPKTDFLICQALFPYRTLLVSECHLENYVQKL